MRQNKKKFIIMCIYTDNIIDSLSDKKEIEKVKQELEKKYNIKTIKEVDHILEIEMRRVLQYT